MTSIREFFTRLAEKTGLPMDKLMHVAAGMLVAVVALMLTRSTMIALLAAATVGALKEWYDHKHGGEVDAMDLVATATGGCVVALIAAVLR